jgi:uncharacterized HhH-GPD family protein
VILRQPEEGGHGSRAAVGAALLAHGRELEEQGAAQVGDGFSGHAVADRLVRDSANAFLVAVLFTQGIPAERAWKAPWMLKERLGTFDLAVLSDEDRVREALQRPPMLHRFKETVPRWVSSAARRLRAEYGGDAAAIWAGDSTVLDVTQRLEAFEGIGHKKAVMATEILVRHFGVELGGREHGQVAYDVQVRRVFLRTGLATEDSIEAIEAAAASICPEAPGTLDLAAWLVGRRWCRPREPTCDECRLAAGCAKRTWITVQGVGRNETVADGRSAA